MYKTRIPPVALESLEDGHPAMFVVHFGIVLVQGCVPSLIGMAAQTLRCAESIDG